jgi:hypothetical protein
MFSVVHIKVILFERSQYLHGNTSFALLSVDYCSLPLVEVNEKAGREGGTPGNLRRVTSTITGDGTPEYQ